MEPIKPFSEFNLTEIALNQKKQSAFNKEGRRTGRFFMKKTLLTLSLIFFLPLASVAQESFYLAGQLGVGTLNDTADRSDKFDNDLTYALRAGMAFTEHLSLGVFLNKLTTRLGLQPEVESMQTMAELTYYPSGIDEDGFLMSALLGVKRAVVTERSQDEVGLAMGMNVGYQFALTPNFSLSPRFSYNYAEYTQITDFSETSVAMDLAFWF